jgi:hypothetical protein
MDSTPETLRPARANPLRRAEVVIAIVLFLAVALLYLSTLQTDVSGSDSEYTLDTGEFQNALALWGTLHHTGYPLYSILGSPFVSVTRALGATPAAGASLFSLVWSVGTVALMLVLARALGGRLLYGVAAALVLAATHSFWVHSVIAEVYSLALFLTALALWLTLVCARRPEWLPWLGAALGLAVGHHRAAALLVPGSALYLLAHPQVRRHLTLSLLLKSALAFAATFLLYLYLPLRATQGAPWLFSRPDTWAGFWGVFFASEVSELMVPQLGPAQLWPNFFAALRVLRAELTLPGLLAGTLGLVLALSQRARRPEAALLLFVGLAHVLFAAVFPRAVFLPAVLLPALLVVALGVALLLVRLASLRRELGVAGAVVTVALAVLLMARNRPEVLAYSRHPAGRELIDAVAALDAPHPVVAVPWGTDYFALAYSQKVTGEIAPIRLTPHEEHFIAWTGEQLAGGETVYLPADLPYAYPIAELEQSWGPLCLSSAGWGLLAAQHPPCGEAPQGEPVATWGEMVALLPPQVEVDWQQRRLDLSLWWQALQPLAADYSVFVHLTDQPQVTGPQDIMAQGDSAHPVYGWSPTSRWQAGQVVRDDYRISWPQGRAPMNVVVGMYRQDPQSGEFVNLGAHTIGLHQVQE